jgi:quinol monooxygenase YgiN
MSQHAAFVQLRTRPGKREEVQNVWSKHLEPLIRKESGFLAYFYCLRDEPDSICAFQTYSNRDAAAAFVKTPEYAAYYAEIKPLLLGEAEVTMLEVKWSK